MHFTIYRIIIIHFYLTSEPNLLYKSMISALKNFAVNNEKNYDPRHAVNRTDHYIYNDSVKITEVVET